MLQIYANTFSIATLRGPVLGADKVRDEPATPRRGLFRTVYGSLTGRRSS